MRAAVSVQPQEEGPVRGHCERARYDAAIAAFPPFASFRAFVSIVVSIVVVFQGVTLSLCRHLVRLLCFRLSSRHHGRRVPTTTCRHRHRQHLDDDAGWHQQ
jgi:hypothetical protein